jgi:hypothetical protein
VGWFDAEVTYTGDISIAHLIEKLPENPIKAAVREAIQSNYEIVDAVTAARSSTMAVKVKAYYDFVIADPALDLPVSNFPLQLGDALPFITIKENRNNLLDSGMTAKIEASEKALRKLNLSLSGLTTAINSGGGTVDDVHVMFGANVWSNTAGTAEYFFRLFNKLYDPIYDQQWWMGFSAVKGTDAFVAAAAAIQARKAVDAAIASGAATTTIDSLSADLVAKENILAAILLSTEPNVTSWNSSNSPLTEGTKTYYVSNAGEYTQTFSYLTVTKKITSGVIGPVGHYVKSLRVYNDTSFNDIKNLITLDGTLQHNFDSVAVSRQISSTFYETYTIYGMAIRNQVRFDDGSYKFVYHSVSTGLHGTFVVPLFAGISAEMNDFVEEKFLSDSLILFVQTVSETKTEWYESTAFKWIVAIVIIIGVTILTWGSGTTQAILLTQGFMAAVQATALTLISYVIGGIALSYVIKGIIAILTPLIGVKAATAITMVAVIAITLYTGYGDVNFADLPWAEILLKTGASVIDVVQSVVQLENAEELLKLTSEKTAFSSYSDLVTKELNRGMDLLDTSIDNLLYSTMNSVLIVRETPDDFYNRTIHQGNVGILGIDAVSNYTSNKLVLPKELPSQLMA